MADKGYNGWSNYETWVVNLWMDNERGSYDYWRSAAQECVSDATPSYNGQTQKEAAAIDLADQLKAQHEESLPELKGFAADLLNAAVSEVNWYEIATHLLEELPADVPTK